MTWCQGGGLYGFNYRGVPSPPDGWKRKNQARQGGGKVWFLGSLVHWWWGQHWEARGLSLATRAFQNACAVYPCLAHRVTQVRGRKDGGGEEVALLFYQTLPFLSSFFLH